MNKTWKYLSGLVLWVSGLVFESLDLNFWSGLVSWISEFTFGCLDVYFWCPRVYFWCLDLYFGCQDLNFGCLALYLGVRTWISGVRTLRMCNLMRLNNFLWNFANMASPAEMTITTRTASKFCAKRCAVQPPIFVSRSDFLGHYCNYKTLAWMSA